MAILTNKKTGNQIDSDSIYSQTDDGVVVINENCWKFIPADDIEKEDDVSDVYYSTEAQEEYKLAPRTDAFYSTTNDIEDNYLEKAQYRFGFKNLYFYNKTYCETSAITSNEIDVSTAETITITSKDSLTVSDDDTSIDQCYNSSVEYYIVDGISEYAILPTQYDKVIMEKLFYELPTRFSVDETETDSILYEDGIQTTKHYSSLTLYDYEQHTYCLTYVPGGDPYTYTPNNDEIKVKMIIRNYSDTFSPAVVSGVIVNKHGESLEWI